MRSTVVTITVLQKSLSAGIEHYVHYASFCSSEEWKKVSKSEREKLGVTVQDDGEFW